MKGGCLFTLQSRTSVRPWVLPLKNRLKFSCLSSSVNVRVCVNMFVCLSLQRWHKRRQAESALPLILFPDARQDGKSVWLLSSNPLCRQKGLLNGFHLFEFPSIVAQNCCVLMWLIQMKQKLPRYLNVSACYDTFFVPSACPLWCRLVGWEYWRYCTSSYCD